MDVTHATRKDMDQVRVLAEIYAADNHPDKLARRTHVHRNNVVHDLHPSMYYRECAQRTAADEPPPLDKIPHRTAARLPADPSTIPPGDRRDDILECFQLDPHRTRLGAAWDGDVTTFYEAIVRQDLHVRDIRFTGCVAGLATNSTKYYTQYSARTNFVEFLRGKLWYENIKDQGQLTHGHRHEESARQEFLAWYKTTYGRPRARVDEPAMMASADCPWLGVSVDGIVYDDDDTPKPQALLEIKCPFYKMHTDNHPYAPAYVKPEYMSQMQLYAGYLNRYFPQTYRIDRIFLAVWQPSTTYITEVRVDDAYYTELTTRMQQSYFDYFLPALVARERKQLGYKELPEAIEKLDPRNYQRLRRAKMRAAEARLRTPPSTGAGATANVSSTSASAATSTITAAAAATTSASSAAATKTTLVPVTQVVTGRKRARSAAMDTSIFSYRNVFWLHERKQLHTSVACSAEDWARDENWLSLIETDDDDDDDNDDDDDDDNNDDDNRDQDQDQDDDNQNQDQDDQDDDVEDVGDDTMSADAIHSKPASAVAPTDRSDANLFVEPYYIGEAAYQDAYANWCHRKFVRCIYDRDDPQGMTNALYVAREAQRDAFARVTVDLCSRGPPTEEHLAQLCDTWTKEAYTRECVFVFPLDAFGKLSSLLHEFQEQTIRFYSATAP